MIEIYIVVASAILLLLAVVAVFDRMLRPRVVRVVRPDTELYARTTYAIGGWTYEPGVEFRGADNFDGVVSLARFCVDAALRDASFETGTPEKRARIIGRMLAVTFPDRAYFVEVFPPAGDGDSWAQTFQPYGVPRWK